MDHLQSMRAFARVVETGGFSRAAQSLQMPNASLSKAIKSLETRLGVKLLERSTRRVSVTQDGLAYYHRTKHLLAELDEIESTLGRTNANPKGRLRVNTGGAVASTLLMPALPDFYRLYPDIQVDLGVTDRTVDVIGENVDCAIRNSANDGALIARKIGSLAWTTCASPHYLARFGTPNRPEQLESGHFPVAGYIGSHSGELQTLHFRDAEKAMAITPFCGLTVNDSNAHLAAALNGLGLIQTADFMARPAIIRGELSSVLDAWRPAPMAVYVNYAPSRQLSTKVRVFIDWVSALFADISARQPK
ncbi:LysR family transcriptional regulator [Gallaecimonas mangrovi]|uniref:LysR substrate-binding domain-containing protein n=1 Tax=Gallaecimonas mangrovi TaxID=2291597 RepID=UPI000E2091EA|nr:LysR family transcriptional regulator [Gallaecimonas mangrovi]